VSRINTQKTEHVLIRYSSYNLFNLAQSCTLCFYLPLSEQAFQELQVDNDIINTIRLNTTQIEQNDVWTCCSNSGLFSSASYYDLMFQGVVVQPIFPKLWKCKCVPKMKVFTWLLLINRFNTHDMMIRRHWHLQSEPNCVTRGLLETRDHLFIECPFAMVLKASAKQRLGVQALPLCLGKMAALGT
jgi:hypothetical protein